VIDSKRDRAPFLLAYRHGLRASEVGLLHVSDVDLRLRLMLRRLKVEGPQSDQAISCRGLDWLMKVYGKTGEAA
jgi:site-specific recombinase XerC